MAVSKRLASALTLAALVSIGILSACNTVHGAGKDIEATGDAIQDASKDDSKN